jgi:hypothetical protein
MLKHALVALVALSLAACGALHNAAWSPPSDSNPMLNTANAPELAPSLMPLLSTNNFIRSFTVPTTMGFPWFEALGSDGNVWFTE